MPCSAASPNFTRFLSEFTLGFSDGLTVPFALAAGLSSLGRTDTVIYAGLAELCAGSISMGISGYLSAIDEIPSNKQSTKEDATEEELGVLYDSTNDDPSLDDGEKKGTSRNEVLVRRHLEPLGLSAPALSQVFAALSVQPGGLDQASRSLQSSTNFTGSATLEKSITVSPVMSGLSISIGYVIGGIIPLLPYFFVSNVGTGLRWSIGLCLLALFAFGSGKSWFLRVRMSKSWQTCVWEGVQMMILGSLAAAAAVLCVQLLGSPEGAD